MEQKNRNIISNNWEELKFFTDARISLGRAGSSLPTKEILEFQLAHAKARDAVYSKLNINILEQQISNLNQKTILLHSEAPNRIVYLKKPDLGRKLNDESIQKLNQEEFNKKDLCIIIGDGLSAQGISENASLFLNEFLKLLSPETNCTPILIVEQARVGIVDHIGEILSPKISMILIGERPGLSSPDSMGIYITYKPKLGRKDSERNCISNVRKLGLNYFEAAKKSKFILDQANALQLTGIHLKDTMLME